ncbi:MAG: MauE/DoxX family redox-associated membrane protein [Mycobacterium sp.]
MSIYLRTWWPWASIVARVVVGVVWIVAGVLKMSDSDAAVRAVRAYHILPEAIVPVVGRGLPMLEIMVGALLIVGLGVRVVAIVSGLMFIAFIIGISAAWARGLQIDCGCFGGGGFDASATAKYPWDIARDVGLLILSVLLAAWPRSRIALDDVLLPAVAEVQK